MATECLHSEHQWSRDMCEKSATKGKEKLIRVVTEHRHKVCNRLFCSSHTDRKVLIDTGSVLKLDRFKFLLV